MVKIEINEQFKKALDLLEKTNKSVFITGRAGTGKSTLLDYFRNHTKRQIVVLAPTGVAALNVFGETIHSFFRFKPGVTVSEAKKIAKKVRKRRKLFQTLEMIVVDEISMVRADLLDCVDVFLKTARGNKKPFGGLQMALFGDLYQLAPIVSRKEEEVFRKEYEAPYFFSAKAMRDFEMELLELEKVYRQKDKEFIELLNGVRNRSITEEQIKRLNKRFNPDFDGFDEGCVYLTTTNKKVNEINSLNLDKLPGEKHIFEGEVEGEIDLKRLPTEMSLEIKKGAQVMFLQNDSKGRWVNGTIGKVVRVGGDRLQVQLGNRKKVVVFPYTWSIYRSYYNQRTKSIEKEIVGSFTQVPLRLAWAVTVHKGQGKTFDKVVVDLSSGVFAHGQAYVALSRCSSFEGMVLKGPIKKSHLLMDWRVVKFLTKYQYDLSEKRLPLAEKKEIIEEAIKNKRELEIVYLRAKDEKSKRVILPEKMGRMEYLGFKFFGLSAFCFKRGEERVFRVDRILEMKKVG